MLFSLVLVFLILIFPVDILRLVIGLVFVLFFPGYTLVAALFPRKTSLGGMERIALSFGLSIAVVPLLGFILNYTPWGIRLYPILLSITVFIVAMCIITIVRRSRLPEEECFIFTANFTFLKNLFSDQERVPSLAKIKWLNKALPVMLIIAILACIGALVYAISTPKVDEKYTEFYILGPEGKAENYPRDIKLGAETAVTVVIVNREQQAMTYRLEVLIEGARNKFFPDIALSPEQKWGQEIAISPDKVGDNQKVEFLLYKDDDAQPYSGLHIWVNVSR